MQNKNVSTYPIINKGKTGFHLKLSINSLTIALMNYFSDLWITMTLTQNRSCPHSNLSGKSCSQSPWTLLFTSPKHYILGIRPMQTKLFSPIRASPNIRGGPPETRNQPLHRHSHKLRLKLMDQGYTDPEQILSMLKFICKSCTESQSDFNHPWSQNSFIKVRTNLSHMIHI